VYMMMMKVDKFVFASNENSFYPHNLSKFSSKVHVFLSERDPLSRELGSTVSNGLVRNRG